MHQDTPDRRCRPRGSRALGDDGLTTARARLGPIGVWCAAIDDWPAAEVFDAVAEVEESAYSTFWIHEAFGREILSCAGALLARTRELTIATGIANIWARDAVATGNAMRSLAELSAGRFVLGVGIGHASMVSRRGHAYRSPLTTMRAYLAAMEASPYTGVQPAERPLLLLAALGPKMLELAAELADGAHTYLVSPEHTAQARAVLGPEKALAVEQTVVLDGGGLDAARSWISSVYFKLPHYIASFQRQGFGDDDFHEGGSERLLRSVMAIGSTKAVVERVREQFDAGADHVCIQVVMRDASATRAAWRELELPLRDLAGGWLTPSGIDRLA